MSSAALVPMDDEVAEIVAASAAGIFAEQGALSSPAAEAAAERGEIRAGAWEAVAAAGFAGAMLTEEQGGVGPALAMLIARHAGAQALALPLVETMIVNWLLGAAGAGPVAEPCCFSDRSLAIAADEGGWRVSGDLPQVAWARACEALFAIGMSAEGPCLVRIPADAIDFSLASNLAGEPRDRCRFELVLGAGDLWPLPADVTPARLRAVGAAFRSAQIAGALGHVLDMTVGYARDRRQFGKPIAAFQAVQQMLAVMATHTAAAQAAADLAADALADGSFDWAGIAVAKIRTGEAAGIVATLAHQVHGAMGFTQEYPLHLLVRRLWSWRDDFGGEGEWAQALGRRLAAGGCGRDLWPQLTAIRLP